MDNLSEIIVPIIIFIIWTLSSISASKKKRQRPGAGQPGPQPLPHQQPQPYEKSPTPVSNPMDELKKKLENIFTEMGAEPESEQIPEQEPVEEKPPQVESTPISVVRKTSKQNLAQEQMDLNKFYDNYSSQEDAVFKVTKKELKKTVILMEILSPPVSLRE